MKKLIYLCSFVLFAVATSMCDTYDKDLAIDDNENPALLIQKENQPSPEAKCDDCNQETAWARGGEFGGTYNSNGRGNWATYISYSGGFERYDVYAGQHLYAGYIEISEVDEDFVHFYLVLFDVPEKDPWCFQDVEEPVKINGYDDDAPAGNPKVGIFPYKPIPELYTGSVASDGVKYDLGVWEYHDFYGIHFDLGCCD